MEKQIHNKLKKDPSRSDDLLYSYSCSDFSKIYRKIIFQKIRETFENWLIEEFNELAWNFLKTRIFFE